MTIAKQLKVTKFPFNIKDSNGNEIYYEYANESWFKKEYNSLDKEIYYENSDGFWIKREYNLQNKIIYYEDSSGTIIDHRPKIVPEYTMSELTQMLGKEFKIKK